MTDAKKQPVKPPQKKKGRPEGAPNRDYDLVAAEPTRCKCGSTERSPYERSTEQAYAGVDSQGKPYTHIVRKYTCCKSCGQWRIDRFHENRQGLDPAPGAAGPASSNTVRAAAGEERI